MRKQFDLQYYLEHPEVKVVTRDGFDVTILDTDFNGYNGETFVAKYKSDDGDYYICETYHSDGCVEESLDYPEKDLFFDLPDPAKKRVPLTYEDMVQRIKEGKTMWITEGDTDSIYNIVDFDESYAYFILGEVNKFGSVSYKDLMEDQYFADGTPCWKEVRNEQ